MHPQKLMNIVVFVTMTILAFSTSTSATLTYRETLNEIITSLFTKHGQNESSYKFLLPPEDLENIVFNMEMSSLDSVGYTEQKMRVIATLTIRWHDSFYTWNTSKFGGIRSIQMGTNGFKLWFPSLFIANGRDRYIAIKQPNLLNIYSDGTIVYKILRSFPVRCTFNILMFPNDNHWCNVRVIFFHPPVRSVKVAQTRKTVIDLTEEVEGTAAPQWSMRRMIQGSYPVNIEGGGTVFETKFQFGRVGTYYYCALIAPIFLLSLLQLVIFYLPIQSQEKVSFAVDILLAYILFLLILDSLVPTSRQVPYIMIILLLGVAVVGADVMAVSVIVNMYKRKKPMRGLLRKILLTIAVWMRVTTSEGIATTEEESLENDSNQDALGDVEDDVEVKRVKVPYANDWIIAAIGLERLMMIFNFCLTVGQLLLLIIVTTTHRKYW